MARALALDGYDDLLRQLKARIQQAQLRAVLVVNRELVLLYWQIGREIVTRQQQQGWGAKVIDRLARDLRAAFPDMHGFSPRNLKYMRAFAATYPEEHFVQEVLAQMPWYHNITLVEKVKEPTARAWYAQQAIAYGWSRNVLVHQIESDLYQRQGQAISNFARTLPVPQSDLAQQLLKDPYHFDFLTLAPTVQEREADAVGRTRVVPMNAYPTLADSREIRRDNDTIIAAEHRLFCLIRRGKSAP